MHCTNVHNKLTRVENGISIEMGNFQGSGGTRRRRRDDPIVSYRDVISYFEEGGDPDQIITALGPNVLQIQFRNVHKEVLARKRSNQKKARIALAEDWWKDDVYHWQQYARGILEKWYEEEDNRKIMVIYDPEGNNGKTVFCKQFQDANPDHVAYIKKAKLNDMSYLHKDYEDLKYCLIDYTRDDEKYGSPKFIESLKDGVIQSNQYQSAVTRCPNVQVAVMTNKQLKWSTLTPNRWAVFEMKKDAKGKHYIQRWDDATFNKAFMEESWEEIKGEKRPIKVVYGDDYGYFQRSKNQKGQTIYHGGM